MKANPVGWFELYVQHARRARAFYETVLATKLSDFESPTDLEMLAFAREDRAVELGRVEKAGVHREKSSLGPHGFMTLAIVTEGHCFGLHSLR